MDKLLATMGKRTAAERVDRASRIDEPSRPVAIFGLRYLEEEAVEIQDIVGCQAGDGLTCSCIDDGE